MSAIDKIREIKEDGLIIINYDIDPVGFTGYGITRKAAVEMFLADLESSWEVIALEEDSRLTGTAQELKRNLLKLKASGGYDELISWAKAEIEKEASK